MTVDELSEIQMETARTNYDDEVETLARAFAVPDARGQHLWITPSQGQWPRLVLEGSSGECDCVCFRGFDCEFRFEVATGRFMEFFLEAKRLIDTYPKDVYPGVV